MAEIEDPTPLTGGAPDKAQVSELCTQCGLCCMGAIHNAAVLDEDEVAAAREIGLPVLDRPGRPLFALPCPKLEGTRCTIFGRRPRVCGRYRCQLLRDVDAGEMSVDTALGHVEQAKTMLAQVRSAMPAGMTLNEARTLLRDAAPSAPSFDGLAKPKLLKLKLLETALHLYLDRHFRHEEENRAVDVQPMQPDLRED